MWPVIEKSIEAVKTGSLNRHERRSPGGRVELLVEVDLPLVTEFFVRDFVKPRALSGVFCSADEAFARFHDLYVFRSTAKSLLPLSKSNQLVDLDGASHCRRVTWRNGVLAAIPIPSMIVSSSPPSPSPCGPGCVQYGADRRLSRAL